MLFSDGERTDDMCDMSSGRACVALIDTGTSFIGVPAAFYSSFAHRVLSSRTDCTPHGTTQIITCSSASAHSLPTLAFTLSGTHTYTLAPDDYLTDHTIGVMPLHTVVSGGQSVELFILGDTFLRTFYTTFDMEHGAIGIANGKNVRAEPAGWHGWRLWQIVALFTATGIAVCLLCLCVWHVARWWRHSGGVGGGWRAGGGAAASAPLWGRPSSESALGTSHQPQSASSSMV